MGEARKRKRTEKLTQWTGNKRERDIRNTRRKCLLRSADIPENGTTAAEAVPLARQQRSSVIYWDGGYGKAVSRY